jgi:hypothetical protein
MSPTTPSAKTSNVNSTESEYEERIRFLEEQLKETKELVRKSEQVSIDAIDVEWRLEKVRFAESAALLYHHRLYIYLLILLGKA